ncbi:MAG: endonuclease/exonuclease/phosphatase family protein [Akkermansiaceae bacterium]|nr:endonuclease/exonuclease/phosphatase family protein [Akkermansiaceae bacterium]
MTASLPIKVATWNLEWAEVKQKRSPHIENLVDSSTPDVCCFTEVTTGFIPHDGHVITSGPDYGYPNPKGLRRKVILSSSQPWKGVSTHDTSSMPPGRFIAGVSHGIRFIRVCIPWHDAHVSTGRKDAKRWDEHRRYLRALEQILNDYSTRSEPICLLGDYNQRSPKGWQPQDVFELLHQTLRSLEFHTADIQDSEGNYFIDHITTSSSLKYNIEGHYPKKLNRIKLSDHSGHYGTLSHQSPP